MMNKDYNKNVNLKLQQQMEIAKLMEDARSKNITRGEWDLISFLGELDDEFIDKFKDKLNWYRVLWNESIIENKDSILLKYNNYIDWDYILNSRNYPISFIERYKDVIDIRQILITQNNISEKFIEKYRSEINWDDVYLLIMLSENMIERYEKYINKWDMLGAFEVSNVKSFSKEFKNKFSDKLCLDKFR